MATQGSAQAIDIAAFSAQLLENREVSPRARIIAEAVTDLLSGSACTVYLLGAGEEGEVWKPQATAGDASIPDIVIPLNEGTLGIVAAKSAPVFFSAKELVREQYAHLHVRRTLKSLAYLPLKQRGELIGTIEVLSFEVDAGASVLAALEPIADVAASALANAVSYEEERNSALASITRVTQLYDLEKVFSSTLELDQLLPIIGSKFREILECHAVNLWLLQGDESLQLMHQAGVDPTVQQETTQRPGEGVAGDVSDNGEPVLIESAE